jgi:uracil-DNA glycosylase
MMYLLSVTLDTKSANTLRQIPATNIIFRRSQSSDNLNLSISRAFTEARPYLQELIQIVTPKVILFISKTAYNQFKKKLCADVREDHEYEVKTPNGKNHVTLFISATGYLPCLSRNIRLLTVCHPSKYASRTEWSQALKILQDEFRTLGLSPLDPHPAIQKLRVLADHLDMP